MNSRYDFYTESSVLDEEDQETYPDPLSINFNNGKLTEIPKRMALTSIQVAKPWVIAETFFGGEEYDDILLLENNVPYINFLKPGDPIYVPSVPEMLNFIRYAQADKLDINANELV